MNELTQINIHFLICNIYNYMAYSNPNTYLLEKDKIKDSLIDISGRSISIKGGSTFLNDNIYSNNTIVYDYRIKSDRYDKYILNKISDLSNGIPNTHSYTQKEINKFAYDYIKKDVNCKNLTDASCGDLLTSLGFNSTCEINGNFTDVSCNLLFTANGNNPNKYIYKLGNKIDCRNKSLSFCTKHIKNMINVAHIDVKYNNDISSNKIINNIIIPNATQHLDQLSPNFNLNNFDKLNDVAFQYIKRNLNCKTHTNESCGKLFYNYGFFNTKGYEYELYHDNTDCSPPDYTLNKCLDDLSNNIIYKYNNKHSNINDELYNEKKEIQRKVYKKTSNFVIGITIITILIFVSYKTKF